MVTLVILYLCNQKKRGECMVTKIGRPTENPKTIQTRIRMTQDESDMLKECAEVLQKTKTDIVIMGIQMVHATIKK